MAKTEVVEKLFKQQVKNLGFTESMIKKLLPEPELKTNPMYKCAAPMKLWVKTDVESVMQTEAFKKEIEKAKNRKRTALKAVQTKKEKLLEKVQADVNKIRIEKVDLDRLLDLTLKAKQDWYDFQYYNRQDYYYDEPYNAYAADEETQKRWMVNYIRHNLTQYDDELVDIKGKVGISEAYPELFKAVLDKIAGVYPDLKDECEKQVVMKNITISLQL